MSKIPADVIFENEEMAEAAITGAYIQLYGSTAFSAGTNQSVVTLAGLSADELINNKSDASYLQFQNNDIPAFASIIQIFWNSMYSSVYQANSIIEGLEASTTLPEQSKTQLKGEALFIRAFCYFYLVNFFGDVPLAITTDYKINNQLSRSPEAEVYARILDDLTNAEQLLPEQYVGNDRTRVNKGAATAMLARVYLYTKDWGRAEDKSSNVIGNSLYELEQVNQIFQSSSHEAIWQLKPTIPEGTLAATNEGYFFGYTNGPSNQVLRNSMIEAFEIDDSRKMSWTANIISPTDTLNLAYKYKRESISSPFPEEFSMVLRLAEIYLIRAEARARQEKFSLASADINVIRERASLPLISVTGQTEESLKAIIEQERRVEFMVEWGHRWFDLKRWDRAEDVLSFKPNFTSSDLLYPIPSAELFKNSNLKPQNNGY